MDAAIVLAALSGACWAVNIVVVRWALSRTGAAPLVGAGVGITVAAVVAAILALASGAAAPSAGDVARFTLVGVIAPGSSQGLFVASIGAIGPSRSSVLVGTAPMFSVLGAILLLDEAWQAAILVGTVLTVVGGALISWEPSGDRSAAARRGVLLALATAVTFAVRDLVASEFGAGSDVSPWWAGTVVLAAAAGVLVPVALVRRGRTARADLRAAVPEFAASGLMIGLALPLLLAALDRGRVGVVAPLSNAVQNLSVVVLGGLVFGARERTPRILAALVMVVAGGALITAA